jgi:hypothetical protein
MKTRMLKHHAQLIAGDHKAYEFLLKKIERELGLHKTHPDLMVFSYVDQKLGVEEADQIRNAVLRNPTNAPQIVAAIYAHTLTEQAQNALLKITEEPPVHSYIFLVTDFVPHLIPTLRSRFVMMPRAELDAGIDDDVDKKSGTANVASNQIASNQPVAPNPRFSASIFGNGVGIEPEVPLTTRVTKTATGTGRKQATKEKANDLLSVKDFLTSTPEIRLATAKEIHAALDKETLGIGQVWNFVNGIEKNIHAFVMQNAETMGTSPKDLENQEKMRDMLDIMNRTQKYMHAPGNSVKMLLEYLAVRL